MSFFNLFKKSDNSICPNCKSHNIEITTKYVGTNKITILTCHNCGKTITLNK